MLRNIRQLVQEAGGRMEHLTKLVVHLTDVRHREPVYRVLGEYIRSVHPVCTGLVVVALARPEWLVESDAMAMISDKDAAGRSPSRPVVPASDAPRRIVFQPSRLL